MAFGGADLSGSVSVGTTRPMATSGNTSTPRQGMSSAWIIGVVLVEAGFLVYGRHLFRNFHGG